MSIHSGTRNELEYENMGVENPVTYPPTEDEIPCNLRSVRLPWNGNCQKKRHGSYIMNLHNIVFVCVLFNE